MKVVEIIKSWIPIVNVIRSENFKPLTVMLKDGSDIVDSEDDGDDDDVDDDGDDNKGGDTPLGFVSRIARWDFKGIFLNVLLCNKIVLALMRMESVSHPCVNIFVSRL